MASPLRPSSPGLSQGVPADLVAEPNEANQTDLAAAPPLARGRGATHRLHPLVTAAPRILALWDQLVTLHEAYGTPEMAAMARDTRDAFATITHHLPPPPGQQPPVECSTAATLPIGAGWNLRLHVHPPPIALDLICDRCGEGYSLDLDQRGNGARVRRILDTHQYQHQPPDGGRGQGAQT